MRGQMEVTRFMNKRVVCLCNDCQAYAHYLGRADRMLDANGGTEIVPVHPARLQLTQGKEHLACVRLSDDGVYRWYAGCCRTPIANTPAARLPYAGVVTGFLDPSGGPGSLEAALGPVFARINGKHGIPPLPPGTAQDTPSRMWLHVLKFILAGKLMKRRTPSPFTDPATDRPALKPKVLSDPEYYALIALTGPRANRQAGAP
jgi:hypothetical protein